MMESQGHMKLGWKPGQAAANAGEAYELNNKGNG